MRRYEVTACAGGGDSAGLEERLEANIAGASMMVSSGVGGALNPVLCIGDTVFDRGTAPDALVTVLTALVPEMREGMIVGSDTPIVTVADKAILRALSSADMVDMETQIAARVALRHGVPFMALRVVSDTAADALPSAALAGMKPDGRTAPIAVLGQLIRHPSQLPALIRTARNAAHALRVLGSVHRRLDLVGNVREHLIDMV